MDRVDDFRHYLALGDSISIDLYPGLDVAEREGLSVPPDGLGAASLLFENDDERWPAFEGRDLSSRNPDLEATNLCQDGATLRWVVGLQLPRIPDDLEGPVLVTLTAGGNDLLHLLKAGTPGHGRSRRRRRPRGRGRSGRRAGAGGRTAPGGAEGPDRGGGNRLRPVGRHGRAAGRRDRRGGLEMLHTFNERVRALGQRDGVRVASIHDHFLGHGLKEPDPAERWYWRNSIIEPSARGASEVRRLFLEAVDGT